MRPTSEPTLSPAASAAQGARDEDDWPDLRIEVRAVRPRIAPGTYLARTVDMRAFRAFRRRCLQLDFAILAGDVGSPVIANLPMFFRLPPDDRKLPPANRQLGGSAKLIRLFQCSHSLRLCR